MRTAKQLLRWLLGLEEPQPGMSEREVAWVLTQRTGNVDTWPVKPPIDNASEEER